MKWTWDKFGYVVDDGSFGESPMRRAIRTAKPLQIRLRSMLALMVCSGVIFGLCRLLSLGYPFAVFAAGLIMLFALLLALMCAEYKTLVVVYEANSAEDASKLQDSLIEQGVAATVGSGQDAGNGVLLRPTGILVPEEQLAEAEQVLALQM